MDINASAYNKIKQYIDACGGNPSRWYAGVAADTEQRLFHEHGVDRRMGKYIAVDAGSDRAAYATMVSLQRTLGCKGGSIPSADAAARFVYVYRLAETTIEAA
jgi:hypothetical protein